MLEAVGVTFAYRRDAPVLRGVSLAVEPGSLCAILGMNGCGKSTLMGCLSGVLRPQEGTVLLDGEPLAAVDRRERARRVAYVAQHSHANRVCVYDAVLLGRRPYLDGAPTSGDRAVVGEVMGRLGLDDLALRPVDELSGGEYQKVVLARAFAQRAPTLLLDEPIGGLDLANQAEVMAAVREEVERRGVGATVVLHDVNLALCHCDRLCLMRGGIVVASGGPEVVTPASLREVYGIEADVIGHGGRRVVVPSA